MADVTISYKGASIATMDASGSKTLNTQGKYCEDNITVSYVAPSGGATPSGTVSITENGTKDVTNYASANVNVSAATAFGTHNGWKIAKFHTVSSDIGNGATCTIDTGVTATRYMLICMSVTSRTTWGLQAAHFSVGAYTTAGALCLNPSTGQMYGQSTSYISDVATGGTILSFTVANGNATVRAGEYLILYRG